MHNSLTPDPSLFNATLRIPSADDAPPEILKIRQQFISSVHAIELEAGLKLSPDQREIFRLHAEILFRYTLAGLALSQQRSDDLLHELAAAKSVEQTLGDLMRPSYSHRQAGFTWQRRAYQTLS
jgi:hypothetical protein